MHGAERRDNALLGGDGFELYCGIVVGPAASGTQAVHVGLDVVIAELTYLTWRVSWHDRRHGHRVFEGRAPGSRRGTDGSSCRTGRTPRRRGDSTPLRHRRRTGPVVRGT